MSLFALSLIYLSFYYFAFALAYWRAFYVGKAPKTRNSLAAMTIGAVGILLIYVPALFAPRGAAALILIAALALVPVFLLGLGSLFGIWIAGLKSRVTLQSAMAFFALAAPFLTVWTLTGGPSLAPRPDLANQEKLAAFQRTTVTGRLGRYPVSLPVSPQIDTYYTCIAPDTGRMQQCHAHFGIDTGLGALPGDIPIFDEVNVARKSEDCTVSCVNFERLARWCSARSDVALQEWCRDTPADAVSFSYDENRITRAGASSWVPAAVTVPDATLECKSSDRGMTCRARYDIARNLQVTILMRQAKADNLLERYETSKAYADRLWSAMTTGP